MAKQNFLAGGYIGKLGETVGQRWKNVRVVRVYVIPHDPKSPAQLQCRSNFKKAIPYAQLGMQFNHYAPCWEDEGRLEWNLRVQYAKRLIDMGIENSSTIPLKPSGYTPEYNITQVAYDETEEGEVGILLRSETELQGARKIMISMTLIEIATEEEKTVMLEGNTTAEEPFLMKIDITGYRIKHLGECFGVSCDDKEHENKMIYIAPQSQVKTRVIRLNDWIPHYDNTTGLIYIESEKAKAMQQTHQIGATLRGYNILLETMFNVAVVTQITGGTGKTKNIDSTQNIVLIEGSSIDFRNSITEGDYLYDFVNMDLQIQAKKEISFQRLFPIGIGTVDAYISTTEGDHSDLFVVIRYGRAYGTKPLENAVVEIPDMIVTGLRDGTQSHVTFSDADFEWEELDEEVEVRFMMSTTDEWLDPSQTVTLPLNTYKLVKQYANVFLEWTGQAIVE